ncbi:MAG: sugar phosphate isomerase/epimerase [Armatimonadetes bacterium]|nr:sugar phosphate isomerase/epimerase [Armatimonadota bacterium]
MKLSATTVMVPEHDLRETAECLAGLGFDGAEWRCRHIPEAQRGQPYSPWGNVKNDLSPANLLERGQDLLAVSAELGLDVVGLATNMPATDLEEVRRVAEACDRWGIPMFRLGGPRGYRADQNYRELLDETVKAFHEAVAITRRYGVKVVLEIHRGTVACSASQAYLVVREFDPAEVGVIYDVANMSLGEGHEPWGMGLDLLGPHLAHCHLAGGRAVAGDRGDDGRLNWTWEVCDLADSVYEVPQLFRQLREREYGGYISLEDFRNEPVESKLGRNLAWVRGLTQA